MNNPSGCRDKRKSASAPSAEVCFSVTTSSKNSKLSKPLSSNSKGKTNTDEGKHVPPEGCACFSLYSRKWYAPFKALLRYSSNLIMTACQSKLACIHDPKGVGRQPVWTTTREQQLVVSFPMLDQILFETQVQTIPSKANAWKSRAHWL